MEAKSFCGHQDQSFHLDPRKSLVLGPSAVICFPYNFHMGHLWKKEEGSEGGRKKEQKKEGRMLCLAILEWGGQNHGLTQNFVKK